MDASAADRELSVVNGLAGVLGLLPLAVHEAARVEDGHDDGGQDHHAALEDHEGDLFVGELAVEAVGELGDAEAGAYEDEEEGDGEG